MTGGDWRTVEEVVAGEPLLVATRPGVFAHGEEDTSARLLAEHAIVHPGDVVVHLNCGNGLFGAAVHRAGVAGRVLLADRNVVSWEAARRTLIANGVDAPEVYLGQGAIPLPGDLAADVVAIRVPQEKLALLQLLRDAFGILKVGGACYLAGANNEGVKPAARALERIFGNAAVLAHGGGHRVVVAEKRADSPADASDLADPLLRPDVFHELDVVLRGRTFRLFSRPGVFSWDHLDEATGILADHIEVSAGDSVLDLWCGSGPLGVLAATLADDVRVTMVDADAEAVRSAARSAEAAGIRDARLLTSDVASAVLGERFDLVVTNPPFHVGKATSLDLPLRFIADGWEVLAPGGRLFLVANRTLPYEQAIRHRFGNLRTLHDGQRFKVLSAVRR